MQKNNAHTNTLVHTHTFPFRSLAEILVRVREEKNYGPSHAAGKRNTGYKIRSTEYGVQNTELKQQNWIKLRSIPFQVQFLFRLKQMCESSTWQQRYSKTESHIYSFFLTPFFYCFHSYYFSVPFFTSFILICTIFESLLYLILVLYFYFYSYLFFLICYMFFSYLPIHFTLSLLFLKIQALLDQHTTKLTMTQSTYRSIEESAPPQDRLK